MSVLGTVVDWNEKRGYGLIETESSQNKVLFHISDMCQGGGMPHIEECVEFDIIEDMNGCQLALNISPSLMK
jgi:CspA family cold shock protein